MTLKRKIAIIGCGPVGMLGSLLFQHLGLDYITLQKYSSPRSHPSAHWLSSNSKSILSQIPGLVQDIDQQQEPWGYYRCYRYLESLFGYQLGCTDHFKPSIQEKLAKSVEIFGEIPNHIPQNLLLEVMYGRLKDKGNLIFDREIREIRIKQQTGNTKKNKYILFDQSNSPIVQAENIILCSGVNTNLRNNLPSPLSSFHLQGQKNLMSIINIHFTSKNLANQLKKHNKNAMLHFIYGKKIIAILVNHSIQNSGTFVLQIPNYQPFVDLMEIYSARDLINMVMEDGEHVDVRDINVIHVGKWKLQGVLTDSMHKNGIFLAGDAAHAYPPAGGFGMNSGFQDIHQLAHSLYLTQRNKGIDENAVYNQYSQYRRKINSEYLKKAMQNYEVTKNLSISLGYSPNILDYFSKSTIMVGVLSLFSSNKSKTLEPIRLKAMSLMYRRQFLNSPGLDLFFDQFDYSIQKISKIRPMIMRDIQRKRSNSSNFYACQGEITKQKIRELVGNVQQKNIQFYKRSKKGYQKGQKLISSNGNIVLE